ncbi:MAG: hypothetical protein ACJ8C4_02330 [Gemmataceae bacterium]
MTRFFKLSVVVSLVSCFTLIGLQLRQASGSPPAGAESSASYRYRTSQIAHWRAIAMRTNTYH